MAATEACASASGRAPRRRPRRLPAAERALDRQQLCELGGQMMRRKLALARPHAGELAVDIARAAPAKTAIWTLAIVAVTAWLVGAMRRHHHHSHA